MERGKPLFLVGAGRAILNGVVLTAILVSVCQAETIYVDDDAPFGGDGTTWTTAYKYFQDALANAGTDDTEIRVAQGTYKPDQDEGGTVTPGDRTATFELLNDVTIYGGYAGIGAPDPDLRDVDGFVSIFNGDLADDDAPDFANYDENSYHVITAGAEITDSAVLDGVTVEHGNANGSSEEETDRGAGMLIFGSPAILNCTLHKNTAIYGSAVCNWGGPNPTFTGCTFSENLAVKSGGAIYCYSDSTLLDCLIEDNQAKWGGGFYANGEGTDVILQNVTICSNEVIYDTVEHVGGSGGGVFLGNSVNATFENCTIEANSAMWGGGITGWGNAVIATLHGCTIRSNEVVYNAAEGTGGSGGGIFLEDGACAMVDNCVIEVNNGTRGGGVYLLNGGLLTMSNCQVRENWVTTGDSGSGWGGGIGLWESEIYLVSSRIYDNAAPGGGGGLSIYGSAPSRAALGNKKGGEQLAPPDASGGMGQSVPYATRKASEGSSGHRGLGWTVADSAFFNNTAGWGGGLAISAKDLIVTNCTFDENDAANQGGGIFCMYSGSVTLGNCILWGNVAMGGWQLALYIDCVGTVSYSDVEGGEGNVYVDQSTLNWGKGNMDVDPLFVDPDGSDDVPGTVDDDFRLSPGSLCIAAGSNGLLPPDTADLDSDGNSSEPIPVDLDGHARILCDPIDMGAYEFGIGDYNCDQTIDLADFTLWESCMTGPDNGPYDSGCEAFDFEFDDDVDLQDFAGFQATFGGP